MLRTYKIEGNKEGALRWLQLSWEIEKSWLGWCFSVRSLPEGETQHLE